MAEANYVSSRARFNRDLGARLLRLRLAAHCRQAEAANAIGMAQASISNYERALRAPSHWTVTRLEGLYVALMRERDPYFGQARKPRAASGRKVA